MLIEGLLAMNHCSCSFPYLHAVMWSCRAQFSSLIEATNIDLLTDWNYAHWLTYYCGFESTKPSLGEFKLQIEYPSEFFLGFSWEKCWWGMVFAWVDCLGYIWFEKASCVFGYSCSNVCAFYARCYCAPFWCNLCNSHDHAINSCPYYACYA